ncbi:MAG: hypothetical protein ACREEO_07790, partial [Phenylobacterium sp.]
SEGPGAPGLSQDQQFVLQLTDALLETHTLQEAQRRAAVVRLGYTQLADLVLTVGHYQQVCNFLNVFGVPVEDRAK